VVICWSSVEQVRGVRSVAVAALAAASIIGVPDAAFAASVASGPREPFGPRTELTAAQRPGGWLSLTTAPSRRAADSVGINLDTWSRSGAYTAQRWPWLRAAVRQLGVRSARVDVHLVSGDWGTLRQQQLGQDGVRLNVQLGDAFGRYSATPFDRVYDLFRTQLLPYAEAVEGTNEPDLSGDPQWAVPALAHQRAIVSALAATPGTERLAVYGPASARPVNQQWFGDLTGLADYANTHAYSGGRIGSAGLDLFNPPAAARLPGGPLVVTEAGWQTEPSGVFSQPGVSEAVAARYLPKLVLESVRRGIPRTYLFDLADRFDDPALQRIEAHFGLLHVDGTPKPAFGAVARLMAELRDGAGTASAAAAPLLIRPSTPIPPDVRVVALRHSDGSVVLAVWRERSLWDTSASAPLAAPRSTIRLTFGERFAAARVRSIAGGGTSWQLPFLSGLSVPVADDVTVVRLMGRF
jgi:hypothetical protein